jgi:hypothetical protein
MYLSRVPMLTVILLLMIGKFNVITVPNLGIPQKYYKFPWF